MLKAEAKTKNNNNFNSNFNREARDNNKDSINFGNNTKGKEGKFNKNSEKVKITKGRELKVGRNAGSAEERVISGGNVRTSKKTRNSRALWGELG